MKAWQSFSKPLDVEADVPLTNDAPADVATLYAERENGNLVAWVSDDGRWFGCIRLNRSVAVPSAAAEALSLFELKPARGAGVVGISVNAPNGEPLRTLLQCRHSEPSLLWLKSVRRELARVFHLREEYEDLGYDA